MVPSTAPVHCPKTAKLCGVTVDVDIGAANCTSMRSNGPTNLLAVGDVATTIGACAQIVDAMLMAISALLVITVATGGGGSCTID